MPCELTLVIPTFNERENIQPLFKALTAALKGIVWEAIFIDDDSPDGTYDALLELAQTYREVRCIKRLGRKGLSSACVEGVLASTSPYLCIMDADMQHDESIIPQMLAALKQDNLDLVIGSRYVGAGSTGALPSHRVWISKLATQLGRTLSKNPVSDPMSGFFLFKRTYFESIREKLSIKGFKILLDMLVSSPKDLKYRELPYTMRERNRGVSKLGTEVIWEFFLLVADKMVGRIVPVRFISFITIGCSGVLVHLSVLSLLYKLWGSDFIHAQTIATIVAMTSNYVLNNHYTYSDRRLTGMAFVYGLFSFYLACSLGAVLNVAFAGWLFDLHIAWWLAGFLGAMSGAVWNYAVTAMITWRQGDTNL